MSNVSFLTVSPIGDTDIRALPVRALGPAIAYYTRVLGFTLTERTESAATLTRDQVKIGLEVNSNDPEQASCYFGVSDVEALRAEYVETGLEPSPLRTDSYGGKRFNVFFAKEPYGVCFCFGTQMSE